MIPGAPLDPGLARRSAGTLSGARFFGGAGRADVRRRGYGGVVPSAEPPDLRPFSVHRGVVYVDESGQFRSPRGGGAERPLVAAVVVRDTLANRRRIAAVAGELRGRRGTEVKGSALEGADYATVTGLVSDVGYLAWSGVEYAGDEDHPTHCRRRLRELAETIDLLATRVRRPDVLPAIRRTREQLAHADSTNIAAYVVQLAHLLRMTAVWFRRNRILPDLRVVLDQRLPLEDLDLAMFLVRWSVADTFPEIYGTRVSAIWEPSVRNACRVSTDLECDGLLLADALAYACGRVARHDDDTGKYSAILKACERAQD